MTKKIIFVFLVFFTFLLYLHQKVIIYVEAYKLNETYKTYNKLIDTRDILLYNFSKKVSLEKINSWVETNGFKLIEEDKVLALNINNPKNNLNYKKNNKFASSFNRLFSLSSISRVLARER